VFIENAIGKNGDSESAGQYR